MCILFLHTNPDPKENEYRLIIATNRDEYYKRPAKNAYQCPETGIIAGRDMEPGREDGSWLGFVKKSFENKSEKFSFACLTNISGHEKVENPSGRGTLVIDYLKAKENFPDYIQGLKKNRLIFNGFNLIGVELDKEGLTKVYHTSNFPEIFSEYSGKHTLGFGNSAISSPYIKVLNGRNQFLNIIEQNLSRNKLEKELLDLLKDKTKHLPDVEIAKKTLNDEKALGKLSSIFVDFKEDGYGTRTHTIILLDKNWNLEFTEVTMKEPINSEHPKWITSKIEVQL